MLKEFWKNLDRTARIGFVVGVAVIIAATIALAYWLLRTDYQVLFADLAPADAAVMMAELDRAKIPYKLGEGGSSILVEKDLAYKTRIKLLGKDLPLHGAVGFELFNNADFGMTEFAQKVNYQRALQGELTRTILALEEIQAVRVHLALPEERLFKRPDQQAKASITLTLKPGRSLQAEQISGIQRLVSASVPGINSQEVTIIDQHGVALTRLPQTNASGEVLTARLELKKETENYLSRKATEVLERALGVGQALVSVDVTLNLDQVRVTTEDVIGTPSKAGAAPTGVIVREREIFQEGSAPLNGQTALVNKSASANSQHEVEYQAGRRVENVVSTPGSVRRLQVVAIVQKNLKAGLDAEAIKEVVASAVGASKERGDSVVVYSLDAVTSTLQTPTSQTMQPLAASTMPNASTNATSVARENWSGRLLVGAILLVGLAVLCALLISRQRAAPVTPALNDTQRQAALQEVRRWLSAAAAAPSHSSEKAR